MIPVASCQLLDGPTAMESVLKIAPDRGKFLAEVKNYLEGGVVINTPRVFIMAKPIRSDEDPSGQWWVQEPDAWYVRWAAGEGAMRLMMEMGAPLPYVVFRRIKGGVTGKWKRYEWNELYQRVSNDRSVRA